jgi:hypothetical protein
MPGSSYFKQTTSTYYKYFKQTGTNVDYVQEGPELTLAGWHTGTTTSSLLPSGLETITAGDWQDVQDRITGGGLPKPPGH